MFNVKKVCPHGCKDTTFSTSAHVAQLWEVDGSGDFINVIEDCTDTTHRPHLENIWECMVCGADAVDEGSKDDPGGFVDKFHLQPNGRIEWAYYNPDGYGEQGQYVQHILYHNDVLMAMDEGGGITDAFWEHLMELGKQYLIDNDGGADFKAMEDHFNSDIWDYHGMTGATQTALITFAQRVQERELNRPGSVSEGCFTTTLIIFAYETGDASCRYWQEFVVVNNDTPVDFDSLEDSISSYMESNLSDDKDYSDMTEEIMAASGYNWRFLNKESINITRTHTFWI